MKFPSLRSMGIQKIKIPTQVTPENVEIKPVKQAENPGIKFRAIKRSLAHARTAFKREKV